MQKIYCQEEKKIIPYRHNELEFKWVDETLKVSSAITFFIRKGIDNLI